VQEILVKYDKNNDGTLDDDEIRALINEYKEKKGACATLRCRGRMDGRRSVS
jgi:hypothetical protein